MQAIYEAAHEYLGLEEYPGARHNPKIVEFAAATGNGWVQDDETPWCASFVGAVLAQVGIQGTGRLNARSYLEWGETVSLDDAQPGDVVVFWRGARDGWQGHVGFYAGVQGDYILVLGGNQGNAVSIARYANNRLLGVRRVQAPRSRPAATKTGQVSIGQVGAGAASVVTGIAALDGQAQQIAVAAGVVLGAFGIWFFWNRIKDFRKGAR